MTNEKKKSTMVVTRGTSFYRSLNKGFTPEQKNNTEQSIVQMRKDDRVDALEEAKRMAIAAREIESLKGLVPKSVIEELRKKAGLTVEEEDEKEETDEKSIDPMLIQLLQEEKDPRVRQAMIMSALGGGKKGNMTEMMLMANMFGNQQRPPQEDGIMAKLLDKFLDTTLNNKDPEDKVLEKIAKYKEIFGAGGGGDSLDKFIDSLERGKKLGLVGDAGVSPELELKIKELELNHEDKKAELEIERDKAKMYSEIMDNGVAALMGSIGALTGGEGGGGNKDTKQIQEKQQSQQPTSQFIPVECPNCQRKMNIPKPFDKREVKCGTKECPIIYHVEGDGNAYYDEDQLKQLQSKEKKDETEHK